MKHPSTSRFFRALITASAALCGAAAAHPGGHARHSPTCSGIKHYLTHPDHVGPVLAVLLLAAVAFRHRESMAAAITGWRGKNRKGRKA
jgi:hydrogenase/urease accessory protein HupE